MTEDESQVDRDADAQVLREIADSVESGECRGFGIVCAGGSVGYAAAGLHDLLTASELVTSLSLLSDRVDTAEPTVTAITKYGDAEFLTAP